MKVYILGFLILFSVIFISGCSGSSNSDSKNDEIIETETETETEEKKLVWNQGSWDSHDWQ